MPPSVERRGAGRLLAKTASIFPWGGFVFWQMTLNTSWFLYNMLH
jgi:hypothetical protein